ncbi:hypothetical protein A4X09_0g4139 [Tilletia walkeri]|uniref:Uncharacterized protein n=1 Tax=Tilletia walkeri TaxID=117179 RepID=A0A8X7N9D3_9BASI|nr:hypothetical protein A4X09_0g4139 [Tilletia walkeri]
MELPCGEKHALLQGHVIELERIPGSDYNSALSCRVDLSCSSGPAPPSVGSYTHIPARHAPPYTLSDNYERTLDDSARRYGSTMPRSPLKLAAFTLGPPTITTQSCTPLSPDRPLPITHPHRPATTTATSSSATAVSSALGDTTPASSVLASTPAHPPSRSGHFPSSSSVAVETAPSRPSIARTSTLSKPSDSSSISRPLDDSTSATATELDPPSRTPYGQLVAQLHVPASTSVLRSEFGPSVIKDSTPDISPNRDDSVTLWAGKSDDIPIRCDVDDTTSVLTSVLSESPAPHPPLTPSNRSPAVPSHSEDCSPSRHGSESNASVASPLVQSPTSFAISPLAPVQKFLQTKRKNSSSPSCISTTSVHPPACARGGRLARLRAAQPCARRKAGKDRMDTAVLAVRRVSAAWIHARQELLALSAPEIVSSAIQPSLASSSSAAGGNWQAFQPAQSEPPIHFGI